MHMYDTKVLLCQKIIIVPLCQGGSPYMIVWPLHAKVEGA